MPPLSVSKAFRNSLYESFRQPIGYVYITSAALPDVKDFV